MKKIINYIKMARCCYYGYRYKEQLQWKSLPKEYRRKVNFYTLVTFITIYVFIIACVTAYALIMVKVFGV